MTEAPLNNLVTICMSQGKDKQVEDISQRLAALRERTLGPDHPKVAEALSYQATASERQGHSTQAKTYYQQAISIYQRNAHPYTSLLQLRYEKLVQTMEGKD